MPKATSFKRLQTITLSGMAGAMIRDSGWTMRLEGEGF
jgi:hypothetical protein